MNNMRIGKDDNKMKLGMELEVVDSLGTEYLEMSKILHRSLVKPIVQKVINNCNEMNNFYRIEFPENQLYIYHKAKEILEYFYDEVEIKMHHNTSEYYFLDVTCKN